MTPPTPPALADLRTRRDEILALAGRHCVTNLRVYGSVARGDARPGDDIDLLVDFDPRGGGLELFVFADEMSDLVGHRIDIATVVDPRIAEHVTADLVAL